MNQTLLQQRGYLDLFQCATGDVGMGKYDAGAMASDWRMYLDNPVNPWITASVGVSWVLDSYVAEGGFERREPIGGL